MSRRKRETLRGPVLRTAEIAGKRTSSSSGQTQEEEEKTQPATPTTLAAPAGAAAPIEPGMPGAKPFS